METFTSPTWLIGIAAALKQALRLKIATLCDAVPGQVDWGSAVRQTSKGESNKSRDDSLRVISPHLETF